MTSIDLDGRGLRLRWLLLALLLALLVFPVHAVAAAPGSLSQLASPSNCIGEVAEENAQCGTKVPYGLSFAYELQVSPDGASAYSVAVNGDLIEYSRNPASGALSVIGCFSSLAKTEPACAAQNAEMAVSAIEHPAALAISPDGANVYVVTQTPDNVVEFSRNAETGLLTKIGCIAHEATSTECATAGAKGLNLPYGIAVSPDGANVYVTGFADDAVAEFKREARSGQLTQLASPNDCISETAASECGTTTGVIGLKEAIGIAVSPDGKDLYVAAGARELEGDVAALERGAEGALKELPGTAACISEKVAGCAAAEHLKGSEDLVVSPDGKNVYATSTKTKALIELGRDESGALKQLPAPHECVSAEALPGCEQAKALVGTVGVAISPDGQNVYTASAGENAVAVFDRGAEGSLTQPAEDPCVTREPAGCEPPSANGLVGLKYARRLTVSPDGANVYVASQEDHAIAELARAGAAPVQPKGEAKASIFVAPIAPAAPVIPPPVLARSGNVAPISGAVLVRLPGAKSFVALSSLEQIPFGTTIEATHGAVSVTTALPSGGTQTGEFFDGEFILRQGRNGVVVAELTGGNFAVCPTARERSHIARANRAGARVATSGSHVVRKLWANAHGKFSTKGNYAAGAVQGTEWLTEDLCDGTLIRVTRDKVKVTNLVNHRHVEVKTGHKYVAKAP